MKTRQYFQYVNESNELKKYLLLPEDVNQYKYYVGLMTPEKAFSRLTGKDSDETKAIVLIQEIIVKE